MTSSPHQASAAGPHGLSGRMYNHSTIPFSHPMISGPPLQSYTTLSGSPLPTTSLFNQSLFHSTSLNRLNDFASNFYGSSAAGPFTHDTKSYAPLNTSSLNNQHSNSSPFYSYPYPNNFDEFSEFSRGSLLENGNTTPLRNSMSAPILSAPPISEDLSPIDLSNPLTNPSSSQDVPVSFSTPSPPDDGSELGLPPYNW